LNPPRGGSAEASPARNTGAPRATAGWRAGRRLSPREGPGSQTDVRGPSERSLREVPPRGPSERSLRALFKLPPSSLRGPSEVPHAAPYDHTASAKAHNQAIGLTNLPHLPPQHRSAGSVLRRYCPSCCQTPSSFTPRRPRRRRRPAPAGRFRSWRPDRGPDQHRLRQAPPPHRHAAPVESTREAAAAGNRGVRFAPCDSTPPRLPMTPLGFLQSPASQPAPRRPLLVAAPAETTPLTIRTTHATFRCETHPHTHAGAARKAGLRCPPDPDKSDGRTTCFARLVYQAPSSCKHVPSAAVPPSPSSRPPAPPPPHRFMPSSLDCQRVRRGRTTDRASGGRRRGAAAACSTRPKTTKQTRQPHLFATKREGRKSLESSSRHPLFTRGAHNRNP
jgi:hypothetical protein